jgi:hypothetical protein
MKRIKLLVLLSAAMVQAGSLPQRHPFDADLLGKVISRLEDIAASMDNVRCMEEVRRYEDKGDRVRALDRIIMYVDRAGNDDWYDHVWRLSLDGTREKPYRHPSELSGAWSSGEFSDVLRTTVAALTSTTPIIAPEPVSGATGIYFVCGGPCWSIKVRSVVYPTGVEMAVLVDPDTGELREISWRSNALPENLGIARAELTITYKEITIAGTIQTVPISSTYRLIYSAPGNRVARNVAELSGYRRFGSESSMTFDQVATR